MKVSSIKRSGELYPIMLVIAIMSVMIYSSMSLSVLLVILITILGILLESYNLKKEKKAYSRSLMFTVYAVYLFSSLFFSHAFEEGHHFLILDARGYFSNLKMTKMDLNPSFSLFSCYLLLDDTNALHELFYRYCIIFANKYLDGANVLYLTLTNTFFGILALGPIYRVLLKIVPSGKAYKYALLFALLSPFHFYSVTMVRDIVVACFYAHAFELTLDKFKIKNLLLLLGIGIVVWGVRLYSGIFILAFIGYYIISNISRYRSGKYLVIITLFTFITTLAPIVIKSDIYKQSQEEMVYYQEYNQDRGTSSSLSNNLERLPAGFREISLIIFSQMMPFPFYDAFLEAESVDHFYISAIRGIFAIYWYFVSFGLFYLLFMGGIIKKLSVFDEWILLALCLVYILLNIVQIDVRRLMAVYPIMLFLYVKIKNMYVNRGSVEKMNRILGSTYVLLLFIYLIIKGI